MEKLEKKEIDKLGKDLITKYIDYLNDNNMFKRNFDGVFKEFRNKIGLDIKTNIKEEDLKANIDNASKYMHAIADLDFLRRVLEASQDSFIKDNIIIIRVFDTIILSEQKIADATEYNKLLDAIPKEAKEKMSKTLTARKDIEKLKQELVSFEFIFGKAKFEQALKDRLENATFQYARQVFCLMIMDAIISFHKIDKELQILLPMQIDEYDDATSKIKAFFEKGKRVKDFKKTELYLKYYKYINLHKVLKYKEYEAEQKQIVNELFEMILKEEDATKMLELCEDNLFKQRWWYYDKEK